MEHHDRQPRQEAHEKHMVEGEAEHFGPITLG
jgi:hypothetical protein